MVSPTASPTRSNMANIPKLPAFDPKELPFDLYLSLIETNFTTYGVTDDDKKKNLLLVSLGTKIFGTLANLTAPDNPTSKTYAEIVDVLKRHYINKPTYHRSLLLFQQRKKERNESLKDLYSDLKRLAKDCSFGATFDTRLRDQLFMAVDNLSYFKYLVAEDLNLNTLTSEKLLDRIQTLEKAHIGEGSRMDSHSIGMDSGVNKVHPTKSSAFTCKHCGFNHQSSNCRFKHLSCRKCGVKGHMEKVCYANKSSNQGYKKFEKKSYAKNKIKNVEDLCDDLEVAKLDYDDDNMLKVVGDLENCDVNSIKPAIYKFNVNGKMLPLEIDSGAVVSIVNKSVCEKLNAKINDSDRHLSAFGGSQISVLGQIDAVVSFNGNTVKHTFYVSDNNCNNLCGRDLMKKVGIKLVGLDKNMQVLAILPEKNTSEMLQEYNVDESKPINNVEAKIYLREGAVPKFFKARQVPLAHKDLVNDALDELVAKDLIEPVTYSDWASPIVPVLKPDNTMRICVDFKYLNSMINIERYPLPKLEDILTTVSDNCLFSKIDLTNAYLQISVAEEDRKYLVISTEKGLFRYKRLCFGLASAPGIFQRYISQLLSDMEGVNVFLDDILICSNSKTDQHDKVQQVLDRLKKANVQLNKKKCEFDKNSLEFLGFVISDKGVSPSPSKVKAIKTAPEPQNVGELQSFIGLVTYYSRFIHKFAEICAPLYDLTKKNAKFVWEKQHQVAYNILRNSVCNSTLLTCFNGRSKLILEVDGSPVGVGAVLIQVEKGVERPIAFASKKLSSAEKNYSQTDREALAMVFGVTKFKYFVLGREFEFRTDHKPLLGLFGRNKVIPSNANARLIRWSILLAQYQYNLVYKAGKSNVVADALSRLPIYDEMESQVPTEYINMVQSLEVFNYSFDQIKKLTAEDKILSKLLFYVKFGWSENDIMCSEYSHVKNELSIHDGVLLFKNRVLVPSKIRSHILNLLHVGHNGMVAMKAEARQNLWWPNISMDIEERVKGCNICTMSNKQKSQPVLSWSDPGKSFDRLHIDYCGPIEDKYFLIIIDAHSKFADVHICSKMTSSITIECLRRTFCNFGIPKVVVSDNAQYFVSNEIKEFYRQNNIILRNPAPFNPSSNGLCERMVKTFKDGMKKLTEGSLNTRVCRFLYNYRRTVHSSTKLSPDEILFNRKFRSPLDFNINSKEGKKMDDKLWDNQYSIGQAIFARNYGRGATWLPGIVTEIRGLKNFIVKVFGTQGDYVWRRHSDQLKLRHNEISNNNLASENCETEPDYVPSPAPIVSTEIPVEDVVIEPKPSENIHSESGLLVPEYVPVKNNSNLIKSPITKSRKSSKILEPPAVSNESLVDSSQTVTTRSGRTVRPPTRYSND